MCEMLFVPVFKSQIRFPVDLTLRGGPQHQKETLQNLLEEYNKIVCNAFVPAER